jgi:type IV pilus assembly protein PilM
MRVLSRIQKMFPTPSTMVFSSVGIDISDTSLKYVQFNREHRNDTGLRIAYWGDVDVPQGVIERGNVHDITQLTTILKDIKTRTKARYVRMSLPEERAYLFETTVDIHTSPKDIRGILDFCLEENVPISPKDAYFDYAIVGEDTKERILRVVVAVYTRSTIQSYYEACIQAGMIPLSFEIEAQAIARAITPHTETGSYMIVDFGKTRMGVGIVYNGILMYTSTIEIAGFQMSEEMRKIVGDVTESELTKIKNTKGLARTQDNEAIANVLSVYAQNIVDELSVRMCYWGTRSIDIDARAIKKIILCGGSANLFGLPEFLAERIDIPVERAHVWANAFSLEDTIPEISRRHSYGYATAVGLALTDYI